MYLLLNAPPFMCKLIKILDVAGINVMSVDPQHENYVGHIK